MSSSLRVLWVRDSSAPSLTDRSHGLRVQRGLSSRQLRRGSRRLPGAPGLQWPVDGDAVQQLQAAGAELIVGGREVEGAGFRYANTLLRVSGEQFLAQPEALQTECTWRGVADCFRTRYRPDAGNRPALRGQPDWQLLHAFRRCRRWNLRSGSPYCAHEGGPAVERRDKPTGVAVSPAMNHGGPFPATAHPGFTAAGIPAAMLRFAALHSYDRVRAHRLPAELKTEPDGTNVALHRRHVDAGGCCVR